MAGDRAAIEADLRHHFEQGLVDRLYPVEQVFEPTLLDI